MLRGAGLLHGVQKNALRFGFKKEILGAPIGCAEDFCAEVSSRCWPSAKPALKSSPSSKTHLSQGGNIIKKECRTHRCSLRRVSGMKKPRTLLLTGAPKSRQRSGGMTGARLGAGPQHKKLTIRGGGSKKKKPRRVSGAPGRGFRCSSRAGIADPIKPTRLRASACGTAATR